MRQTPKGRLLTSGAILLLLLVVGLCLAGRVLNRIAGKMNERIVTQIGEYHFHNLEFEFGNTEKALRIASDFAATGRTIDFANMEVLTTTLMHNDPKIGRIWIATNDRRCVWSCAATDLPVDYPWSNRIAPCDSTDCYLTDSIRPIWHLSRRIRCTDGKERICGIDLPLERIYTFMTQQTLYKHSYATLYEAGGVILYHPDSLMLNRPATDSTGLLAVRKVEQTGQKLVTQALSDYLNLAEERIYFPIRIGGRQHVVGIGIPNLVIEQEVGDFHRYTMLTAAIAIALFATLLIVAQRRWRREYQLRLLSERESEKLHLQQLIEQIDPHFLFNSLNSLYALIRCAPDQAREFTLTLSRVYRHVLEHRHEILASLTDECDFTWQYYTLQKIRFGNHIELITTTDPALRNHLLPAMSLQTLVENAVKHNHITAENPLTIRIHTEGDSLVVENNYTPRTDQSDSIGVGLDRIRSVYRFYTDRNLTIENRDGLFRCRLPLLPPRE